MFLNKSNLTEAMQITIKIALIVLAITTIGLAPSIAFNQPAKAASHWCENQGKTSEWANGCKQGWSDHDNCYKYEPDKGETTDFVNGYKVGWKKGHCN